MKRLFVISMIIGLVAIISLEESTAQKIKSIDALTDEAKTGKKKPDFAIVKDPGNVVVDSNSIYIIEIDGEYYRRFKGQETLEKLRIDNDSINFDESAKSKIQSKTETSTINKLKNEGEYDHKSISPDLGDLGQSSITEILFSEDFEGSFPGGRWDVVDNNPNSGEDYWDDVSCGNPHQGSWHVWCADIGDQTDCDTYDNNMNSSMATSDWIDIGGYTNIQWSFRIKWDLEITGGTRYDSAAILIKTGGSWLSAYEMTGNNSNWPNYNNNPMIVNINTSSDQLKIRYRMWTDGSITEEGVYVDDIVVTGDSQGPEIYTLEDNLWHYRSDDPGYFQYYQTSGYWAVVGVRSPNNADLDIMLYDDENFTNGLAISQTTDDIDFIVGDYNHNSYPQWDYPKAFYYDGSGSYRIEYENSADILFTGTNGPFYWPANDVVEIWDVYLSPGQGYYFLLNIQGFADLGMALFKSNGGTYYEGKSSSVAASDNPGGNYDEAFIYYAPASDWYGLVVWSNDGSSVDYYIEIDNSLAVEGDRQNVPLDFALLDNYPNPFNAQTTFEYALPKATHVKIEIFDLLGRKIKTLIDGIQQAGYHQVTWNASDQASGLYFYKIHAGDFTETKKMTLLK